MKKKFFLFVIIFISLFFLLQADSRLSKPNNDNFQSTSKIAQNALNDKDNPTVIDSELTTFPVLNSDVANSVETGGQEVKHLILNMSG